LKILVTGANGFIGSNLVKKLAIDNEVYSFILKGTDQKSLNGVNTEVIYGDVTIPETLENIMKDIDVVYHFAALLSEWWDKSIINVNYNGTINVLEEAVKSNVKRFVFMSSLVVHGFSNFNDANEETPIIDIKKAGRPYTKSKILCEQYINSKKNEIETVIIRPGFLIFGPNDVLTTYQLCDTLENDLLPMINHGKAKTCYSYVENLIDGLILAGNHKNAPGETFILCDDKPEYTLFYDFIDSLCKELNVKTPTFSLPYGLAFPLISFYENLCRLFRKKKSPKLTTYLLRVAKYDLWFSCNKAKKILGYEPKIALSEAIKRSVDWYHEYKNLKLDKDKNSR